MTRIARLVAMSLPLLLAAGLAACTAPRQIERQIDQGVLPPADPQKDRQVHLDLIRRMLEQDQNYAALAHIEAQQRTGNDNELRLLEADARRRLGQTAAAQQLYAVLVNTPYAPQAYHGLGLIVAQSNPAQSLEYLRRASALAPTNVELRNDLGYALILARRYPEALPELATAVELDPANSKSRNNLLLLMMLMRDEAAVQRIVRESGVDSATLADLRRRAQSLAANQPPAAASTRKAS